MRWRQRWRRSSGRRARCRNSYSAGAARASGRHGAIAGPVVGLGDGQRRPRSAPAFRPARPRCWRIQRLRCAGGHPRRRTGAAHVHSAVAPDVQRRARRRSRASSQGVCRGAVRALEVVGLHGPVAAERQHLWVLAFGHHLVQELRLVVLHLFRPEVLSLVVVPVFVVRVDDLHPNFAQPGYAPEAEECPRDEQRHHAEDNREAHGTAKVPHTVAKSLPGRVHEDKSSHRQQQRPREADKRQAQQCLLFRIWLRGPLEPPQKHVLVDPVLHAKPYHADRQYERHER
mmetsp:Transcript_26581/g.76588  ORF Transcript_26581/g.76588 Transcript_26581/m.76588 type:complete len:286 (+) Transcript_26581:231-1088(+)